jgi:hypothetical protein
MIQVSFTPECVQHMRDLDISHERARITINDRHQGLVTDGLDRIVAVHWFGDDDIVLVDSMVKDKEIDLEHTEVRFIEVQAQLVLTLRSRLPAGTLARNGEMEQLLSIVA